MNQCDNEFAGQVDATSVSVATAGQDDGFVADPLFEELLCDEGSAGSNRDVGRGSPGWISKIFTIVISNVLRLLFAKALQ